MLDKKSFLNLLCTSSSSMFPQLDLYQNCNKVTNTTTPGAACSMQWPLVLFRSSHSSASCRIRQKFRGMNRQKTAQTLFFVKLSLTLGEFRPGHNCVSRSQSSLSLNLNQTILSPLCYNLRIVLEDCNLIIQRRKQGNLD